MKKLDIEGKKITIIGCGLSGLALCRLVLRLGGLPKISDFSRNSDVALAVDKAGLTGRVEIESDEHTQQFIVNSDYVIISPGVKKDALPIQWAAESGIPVLGEIEFSWMFCKNPVIAVTGSNGKTTVSTLIHRIIQQSGMKSCLCGNIGSPFAEHVLDLSKNEIVVLEISSFQLEFTQTFRPYISIFLNCTANHLDRHDNMQEYFRIKMKIFENQGPGDFSVLNYNDKNIRSVERDLKSHVLYFNGPKEKRDYPNDNPNFLAARKVAQIMNVSNDCIDIILKDFLGIEHRMEEVAEIKGILFINDSKATTPEAGIWALSQITRPIIMICGGRDKNVDFSVARNLIHKKVKKIFVIGESKEKIRVAFSDLTTVCGSDSLQQAVKHSYHEAGPGDCVLFSPMCASFDMFKNFQERGRMFKEIVRQL